MLRELTGFDLDRAHHLFKHWPIEDVLLAYVHQLRTKAREDYALSLQVWAAKTAFGGGSKPPKIPTILR